MMLKISEKILELEDLTQEEGFSIYTDGSEQAPNVRAFGCDEFEDEI